MVRSAAVALTAKLRTPSAGNALRRTALPPARRRGIAITTPDAP